MQILNHLIWIRRVCFLGLPALICTACGGLTGSSGSFVPAPVALTVSITSPASGAAVAGTVNVTTAASANTISVQFQVDGVNSGVAVTSAPFSFSLNTAALSTGSHSLTAVAMNSAGQSATSSSVAIIVNNLHLAITTTSLPSGQVQNNYSVPLQATAGTPPYTWSVVSGQLPAMLVISPSSGIISGVATAAGSFSFTAQVMDSTGGKATAGFSINIALVTPTVSITSPAAGATVAGTISVTTSVSADTTSVQFRVDGANAGLAVTSAPFSLALDTITISNGPHSLTAVAMNAAGQSATSSAVAITINNPPPTSTAPFGHVIIVAEENTNYASVVGNPSMPYLNGLANQYGLATQYYSDVLSSIGAYFIWTTGQVLTTDGSQTPLTFSVSADNAVRELLAAGKSWKQYAESIPSVGYLGGDTTGPDGGAYVARHVPLNYMADVQSSPAQLLNIVPFTQFATDLASGTLPDYSFITPNMCDDAHDCSLSIADNWLKTNIDPLVKSAQFQTDGLLIIAFDESANDTTHGGGHVAAVVVSPFSKTGYKSTTFYQGESVLRLMLEGLGVKTLPGASATAPPMWEFFTFTPPF